MSPSSVYADSWGIYITWNAGGSGSSTHSEVATKYYYSSALTAITLGRTVKVRYADGTNCTVQGGQIIGLWLV